jgi:hypothetical protein
MASLHSHGRYYKMRPRAASGSKASAFFFEKRSKKLLSAWASSPSADRSANGHRKPSGKSFFGSFFSKKELLAFPCRLPCRPKE